VNSGNNIAFLFLGMFMVAVFSSPLLADDSQIRVVGVVEQSSDPVLILITEVVSSPYDLINEIVIIEGALPPISQGDVLYIMGEYQSDASVISVKGKSSSVRKIPQEVTSDNFTQSLHCTGKIMRIFEIEGEQFVDLSVTEVFVVTYQEQQICQTMTIRIDPVAGYVEEGLQPGDTVEFLGTYDENTCRGSLDWYEDYLQKERKMGISWLLVISGCVGYLISRTR
jgi:hypothetical protein